MLFSMSPFNPTMVWFYPPSYPSFLLSCLDFQSHYGLILSPLRTRRSARLSRAFNPTMVWFYQAVRKCIELVDKGLSIPLWSDFISGLTTSAPIFSASAFNPTMVWFYRESLPELCILQDYLSIPLWSDFISAVVSIILILYLLYFQSHYGLILSSFSIHCRTQFWLSFNPTMVWFYHVFIHVVA